VNRSLKSVRPTAFELVEEVQHSRMFRFGGHYISEDVDPNVDVGRQRKRAFGRSASPEVHTHRTGGLRHPLLSIRAKSTDG
jgi:hypothetical protein